MNVLDEDVASGLYWTSKEKSQEVIELSSVNKVSLV